MISDNSTKIFLEDSRKPFVYPGNLNRGELIFWMREILTALKGESLLAFDVERLCEDVQEHQAKLTKMKEIILIGIYPTFQDPIPSPENRDNRK